jgi:hypothetical protein
MTLALRTKSHLRSLAFRALALLGAGLCAHLLSGALGLPAVAPLPIGFAPLEHYRELGREPLELLPLGLAVAVLLYLFTQPRSEDRLIALSGALTLAVGGAMNLSEEALRGSVRDYFWLAHPDGSFGLVFNIADLALLWGLLTLCRLPLRAGRDLLDSLRRSPVDDRTA